MILPSFVKKKNHRSVINPNILIQKSYQYPGINFSGVPGITGHYHIIRPETVKDYTEEYYEDT